MRIESIGLAWFRGAAESVELDPGSKSIVVYGENGSGKSCFVDAVEHVLNSGRIGHLAHEYSGKHQEKAIINTHIPEGKRAEFHIKFSDKSELRVEIQRNGTSTSSGAESIGMNTWDYRRTVLRQDEIADFIRQTKGSKYSALLPLLGLDHMELAAENLRQLAKTVEQEAKLTEIKYKLGELRTKHTSVFGAATDSQVIEKIENFHKAYCANKATTTDPLARCKDLEAELSTRIAAFSADQKRHLTLLAIADLDLKGHVGAVRTANGNLAGAVEPLIAEKLEILETAGRYVGKLKDEEAVKCPACGQSIVVEAFRAHIEAEKKRLQTIIDTFNIRKKAIGTLCDTIKSLRSDLGKADVKSWRDGLVKEVFSDNFTYLEGLNVEALRTSCSEDELNSVEYNLTPLRDAATLAAKNAPPDVQQLTTDKKNVEAGSAFFEAMALAGLEERTSCLELFLGALEQGIRDEIRLQSKKVIGEISSDIRTMWGILHPGDGIEDVRLNAPETADKAIDIGLKFYGVEQDSPRLTLSEGYRNSLGLCIFLAMAKREAEKDRPLFLDDVVVSFDRNHRGMIVELLDKEFTHRQVLILTHDREWYTELRQQLDGGSWIFKALMPYEKPKVGIRWSAKTSGFDDARAQLKDSPDSAGNTARKIMDIELAMRAERLNVRLPYLHREKNDHRVAHDFLSQMISDGAKCFQKKGPNGFEPYSEAIDAFRDANKLLLSWGNKSSHSFDVVRNEANSLISACEKALEFFDCPNCKKPVYKLNDVSAELVQCQCSNLRWRYGKT
jgi:energy-coupling factor transporter ATP-binding protein EcfA2